MATASYYQKFKDDAEGAGFKVEQYEGRNFYSGPAVRVEDWDELVEVIRATTGRIQTDQLGRNGYIVYPRRF